MMSSSELPQETERPTRRRFQFGIRHILVLTAVVAFSLAIPNANQVFKVGLILVGVGAGFAAAAMWLNLLLLRLEKSSRLVKVIGMIAMVGLSSLACIIGAMGIIILAGVLADLMTRLYLAGR